MQFSYANIMSTVAMFAAVSTGGAYAASLADNSVASRNIKNGQVTLVDLHPSVRAKLRPSSTLTGTAPTTGSLPANTWTPLVAPGAANLRRCTNTGCADGLDYPVSFGTGYTLRAGSVQYQLDVTLTNTSNIAMFVEGHVFGSAVPVTGGNADQPREEVGYACSPPNRGIAAGATLSYTCRVQGRATRYAGLVLTTRAVSGQELVSPEASVVLDANVTSLKAYSIPEAA